MELVDEVYKATSIFPKIEEYGLSSQMRRAAVSVPSNLAEGAARKGNKEFKTVPEYRTGLAQRTWHPGRTRPYARLHGRRKAQGTYSENNRNLQDAFRPGQLAEMNFQLFSFRFYLFTFHL